MIGFRMCSSCEYSSDDGVSQANRRCEYCLRAGGMPEWTAVEPTPEEARMDIIAQNGNDGLHYADPIIDAVREKMLQRSQVGMLKYGVGLDRKDLSRLDWLKHAQEEAMDLAGYLEVLIQREVSVC